MNLSQLLYLITQSIPEGIDTSEVDVVIKGDSPFVKPVLCAKVEMVTQDGKIHKRLIIEEV